MSAPRTIARLALGSMLAFAGTAHLTFARQDFQAQVPDWFPADKDAVVLVSGVVEIVQGIALISGWRQRTVGRVVALFFIGVFPGNISQFLEQKDAFGLDTDTKRAVRLAFQPLLVAWALWATNRKDD
ncbi:DoxX family membrane protein [Yimella sp. cx-51]|uniref:DoxX family protein n=1 Tax=Yimella sp. cx-51 TaxID=2770551 RepID=UPI00165E558F|nr:DoxX family membrane protein [Yimella sp. cx-51]MBC9956452.1 DoxX family membrane protein [Yimella sp. cx-51]MBD2759920.1 DoxX family membrane protein [Yimella sp. cx-573]QTH38432.1 DoxX family membrane protein [Yimella sp. cx-51]